MRAAFLVVLLAVSARAAAPDPRLAASADPRLELMGVVQQLAGGSPDAVIAKRFGPWRSHPAVAGYRRLVGRAGRRHGLGVIALFLSPPPALAWTDKKQDLPYAFLDALGGEKDVEAWLDQLRDFARASDFAGYEKETAAARQALGRRVQAELARTGWLAALEKYAGRRLDGRAQVLLSPLFDPGELDEFIIPYPMLMGGTVPPGPYEVDTIARPPISANAALNEPIYALLNADLDAHAADAAPSAGLFQSLRGSCPSPWATCAKHLIVMAVASRVAAMAPGGEAGGCQEQAIAVLSERLKTEYETDRKRYPTLPKFLPHLYATLGDIRCADGIR